MSSVQKREQILEAAERVFRAKGLTGATTREIAREVGCADGTLYLHFNDRLALFLALWERTLPGFLTPLRALEHQVGQRTVRANLEEVLHGALGFQNANMPLLGGLLAEPQLLESFREVLRKRNMGPHTSKQAIEEYVRAEQQRGRVSKTIDPGTVAFTLLGACFYRAFLSHLLGQPLLDDQKQFVQSLVKSLRLRATSSPRASTKAGRRPTREPNSEAK